MQRRIRHLALCLAALSLAAPAIPAAAAEPAPFEVTTIHLAVTVGPQHDEHCDVLADLYRPTGADADHQVAAILMTNGFGGSKDTEAPMAEFFAGLGYGVLIYSGLGFGGSSCVVRFARPGLRRSGGQPARQLPRRRRTAWRSPTPSHTAARPRHLTGSSRTAPATRGSACSASPTAAAPRSSAASVDPRLDAIVPVATWNDLSYSLFPNNADLVRGVTTSTPGVAKTSFGGPVRPLLRRRHRHLRREQ